MVSLYNETSTYQRAIQIFDLEQATAILTAHYGVAEVTVVPQDAYHSSLQVWLNTPQSLKKILRKNPHAKKKGTYTLPMAMYQAPCNVETWYEVRVKSCGRDRDGYKAKIDLYVRTIKDSHLWHAKQGEVLATVHNTEFALVKNL